MQLYFAYGSNLDRGQMAERCPAAEPLRVGHLPGYRLAFGGHSPGWDGAPATILPASESSVPGLLYRLPHEEILTLDRYEGHPVRYERRQKEILTPEDLTHEAYVYIKDLDNSPTAPPDDYYRVLESAYRDLGFDLGPLRSAALRN